MALKRGWRREAYYEQPALAYKALFSLHRRSIVAMELLCIRGGEIVTESYELRIRSSHGNVDKCLQSPDYGVQYVSRD